jgi:hypothetical protein
MDIFMHDPADIPLPPEEVRIRRLVAEPWPDGHRVRITLEITPFQKRPSGEIRILDSDGEEISSFTIIETIVSKMQFTLHLRENQPGGRYTASASLYYAAPLPEPAESASEPESASKQTDHPGEQTLKLGDPLIVDRAEAFFEV